MFNNRLFIFFVFFCALSPSWAQNCSIKIEGKVIDDASGLPLSYVNVYFQETSNGTYTDNQGNFILEGICPGNFHLIYSHIGCETEKEFFTLTRDTSIIVVLSHTSTSLNTVTVTGKGRSISNQPNSSIKRQVIEDNANENLSALLENETGVHLLKNGSGISKPIIHGLFGNRVTILNNGIIQSGQQWGNDHSPEIDPFTADKITVLKGANAIEYGGGNLGSIILVEPTPVGHEPHLHGQVNYAFESNGRGNSINARLQKYSQKIGVGWRINGTFKKIGDRKTPDYFLNNTGVREANFSMQLEKSWNDQLFVKLYGSTFNTQLGILRGSHVGNLTDLEEALTREVPFFTEPEFSGSIESPKQSVSHHLVKLKTDYYWSQNKRIEWVLAGQINNRREFDVRRSGRSEIPALSLLQSTFNSEVKYTVDLTPDWNIKFGNQTIVTDNTNDPETGILPLIPDYISLRTGSYGSVTKETDKLLFNIGLRYDYERQDVVTISYTGPRAIIRYDNVFHNLNGLFSLRYKLNKSHSVSLNSGYATRNPGINELYSNGLHQGVSGIEQGDPNLMAEHALKNVLEYKWLPNPNISITAIAYHQIFNNYIFLNPQEEIRLTIRGAFPVFKYEQTDATIRGLDISSQFTFSRSFILSLKYSYLKGQDIDNDIPLIYMPPNRIYGSLTYRVEGSIKLSNNLSFEDTEIEVNNRYVLKQNNILPEQDFKPPPPAYNLLGLKISTNVTLTSYKIRCFIKADNLLNVSYRDYLNRQRYFADDQGLNMIFGLGIKF